MKVLIVGGVAGGAGTAARLRRMMKTHRLSCLNGGSIFPMRLWAFPYYVGGVITDKGALQLQTPERFHQRFNVDVRTESEVTAVDTVGKTVTVRHGGGNL